MPHGLSQDPTLDRFPEPRQPGEAGTHVVQFYESDAFLTETVADFVATGFQSGHSALIIATPEHRDAIVQRLGETGLDVRGLRDRRELALFDARETLDRLLVNGMPDPRRFDAVIGDALRRCRSAPAMIRAYGEMVDLLWKDGRTAAAAELEELWNGILQRQEFSLLCAYEMGNFSRAADASGIHSICQAHSHVRPTEKYKGDGDERQMAEIALLQQRASALEFEIQRREELESKLRSTVVALNAREVEREQLLGRERSARAEAERSRLSAEQANRAKSEFLAVMSHELRTPLNAIGGYAELMQLGVHGATTPGQEEALDRIQRSQRHLLGLINQVLNYARLETGNVRYDIDDVAIDDVLRTAEALVMPQMRAKSIAYRYGAHEPQPIARADVEKVQQIVLNLLANAVKFTDRGGKISVESDVAGDLVIVRIADTGIGIPAEKLSLIFDPFVQVDSNFTRTREGVGLGLAISRDLARGMHGDLRASSELGKGTTMELTLPRADGAR